MARWAAKIRIKIEVLKSKSTPYAAEDSVNSVEVTALDVEPTVNLHTTT